MPMTENADRPSTKNSDIIKRSAATRSRLIEAGIDVFGERGYEGASTRLLAERAGVNLASIRYYFNGKEGLYTAVVEHIALHAKKTAAPVLSEIQRRLKAGEVSTLAARSMLADLLGTIVDFIVGSPFAPRFARIIMREQLSPTAAYDIIYTLLMRDILNAVQKLVGIMIGDEDRRRCALRAHIIMGHVMPFRVSRETVVRHAGLEGYSTEETAEIRQLVITHALAALDALSQEREERSLTQ